MIIIGVFSVIINFILSRLFVGYIDELLRSNWQYHLYIVFANCIMFLNILLEIFSMYIYIKIRKI